MPTTEGLLWKSAKSSTCSTDHVHFITFRKPSVGNYVSKWVSPIFAGEEIFLKAMQTKLLAVLNVSIWWILKASFHAHRCVEQRTASQFHSSTQA